MDAQINNTSIKQISNEKINTSQSPISSRRVSFIKKKVDTPKVGRTEKLNRSMNMNLQNLVENISPSSSFVINSSRSERSESVFINNQISQISKLSFKEKKENGRKKSYKIIKHINELKDGKEEKDNTDLVIKPKENYDLSMNIYKTYSEEFYSKLIEVNEVNVEIIKREKTSFELEIGNYQFDDLEKIKNLIVDRMNLIKKASIPNEIIKSSQITFNFERKIESKVKITKKIIANIPIIKEIEYIFPIKNENIFEKITNFTINSAYQRVGRRYFQDEMDNFRIMSSYVYIVNKSLISFHPPTINHDSEIVHKSNTCKYYNKYKSKDFMINKDNVYNNDTYNNYNKLELNSMSKSMSISNLESNLIESIVFPTNKDKNYQLIDDRYNSFNTINQSSNLKISTNLKEELKYLLEKNNQSETIKNDRSLFHIFKEFYMKKENSYMIDSIYNNKSVFIEETLTSRNKKIRKMKGNILNI